MNTDTSEISAIEQRLKTSAKNLHRLSPAMAAAKQAKAYDGDRRENILARYTLPHLKAEKPLQPPRRWRGRRCLRRTKRAGGPARGRRSRRGSLRCGVCELRGSKIVLFIREGVNETMRHLTNVLGLPAPLVRAIENDSYDKGECDYTTTGCFVLHGSQHCCANTKAR